MTITYSDFKNLSEEEQKTMLEKLRNEVGVSELIKTWGISRSKIYNMIHDLGLSVASKGKHLKENKNSATATGVKQTKKRVVSRQNGSDVNVAYPGELDPGAIGNLTKQQLFSIALTTQGPSQVVSKKLQLLFENNFIPNTNVRITVNIDEITQ